MTATHSPYSFGRDVMGPIIAEFCLRLLNLASLMDDPDDTVLLFCARGGLRMQSAYRRFLAASAPHPAVRSEPLMISRLVAMRAALAGPLERGDASAGPAATATLHYEFSQLTLADALRALSGMEPPEVPGSGALATPRDILAALQSPAGAAAKAAIIEQAALFREHFSDARGGRRCVVLVDTGLYGTTGQLLAEAAPELTISTALMARTYRSLRGAPDVPALGLSVQARAYSTFSRRTALLRYWHFIEWLFEPNLSSVRRFERTPSGIRSNLEVDGWQDRVDETGQTAWSGVTAYLDALPTPAAPVVLRDADRAWNTYRRAVVWPTVTDTTALAVGTRTHDFGRTDTWDVRPWRGPLAALGGWTMWREGEIAASRTVLRVPLLAAIEVAHTVRHAVRNVRGR